MIVGRIVIRYLNRINIINGYPKLIDIIYPKYFINAGSAVAYYNPMKWDPEHHIFPMAYREYP